MKISKIDGDDIVVLIVRNLVLGVANKYRFAIPIAVHCVLTPCWRIYARLRKKRLDVTISQTFSVQGLALGVLTVDNYVIAVKSYRNVVCS